MLSFFYLKYDYNQNKNSLMRPKRATVRSRTNRNVTVLRICIVSIRRTRARRMVRRERAQTAMTVCRSYSVLF